MYKILLLPVFVILTISACQSTPNRPGVDNSSALERESLQELVRLHISEGNIDLAEQLLAGRDQLASADYLLLAEICRARSQFRCVADALIQASLEIGLETELEANLDEGLSPTLDAPRPIHIHDQIWSALTRARRAPDAFTHRYHLAWWQLQKSIRDANSPPAQVKAWRTWQKSNPSHPATIRPPEALVQLDHYQAPDIAVLLPLTGRLASAGKAIQDAFAASYLAANERPAAAVRFYDTAAQGLGRLWEQVLSDGADVVVGPLLKERVQDFVELSAFSNIPRLTLNYVDLPPADPLGTTGPVFQLGIAIEDEATSLADFVLLQGYERVAIVHGAESWATRAATSYSDHWIYPLTSARFAAAKELTKAVGDAMLVADSQSRHTEISNIIGERLEFLPRARADLEAIIALTNNAESRALIPALRFHFGDHLPVYATSQAARRGDLAALQDFYLTEMPLFADPTQYETLREAFDLSGNPLSDLYALGYDAFRVANWLPALTPNSAASLPGASGFLWLDEGGIFRREMSLTRVSADGKLLPVNP